LRFDRGVLGMALSGPHTGGSQFFVALADQPHLDGGYTAFGRVAEGLDILDQIVQGDRIVGLRPLESNLPRFVMPTTPRSGAE
jgi:cyclophilin family peptidyl-prolyl cis-trans isomerase